MGKPKSNKEMSLEEKFMTFFNQRYDVSNPDWREGLFKKSFCFLAERFEEWSGGRMISSGQVDFTLNFIANQDSIRVRIPNGKSFRMHEDVAFSFLGSRILSDRLQYVNSNGDMKDPTCPFVLHVFSSDDGKEDCVRFAMTGPDRLIEFYGYLY